MTIRIPRLLLGVVAALVVLSGVGVAAYRLGESSGRDDERSGATQARNGQLVAPLPDFMQHHRYEVALLRNVCVYATRIPQSGTGTKLYREDDCQASAPYASRTDLNGHDDRVNLLAIKVCSRIQDATGLKPPTPNCVPDDEDPISEAVEPPP